MCEEEEFTMEELDNSIAWCRYYASLPHAFREEKMEADWLEKFFLKLKAKKEAKNAR